MVDHLFVRIMLSPSWKTKQQGGGIITGSSRNKRKLFILLRSSPGRMRKLNGMLTVSMLVLLMEEPGMGGGGEFE